MLSYILRKSFFTTPKWFQSSSRQSSDTSNNAKAASKADDHLLVVFPKQRPTTKQTATGPTQRPKLSRSQLYSKLSICERQSGEVGARDNLEMVALNMYMDMYVKANTSFSPAPREEPLYNPTLDRLDVPRPVLCRGPSGYFSTPAR
ncbi:hypothetical protein K491DRAFT_715827 [Lophiostoma macrostomum CBS 122681]|uniref:Uncharacterized protein n=1 Tax=Lophiostoma macrostomum CBS 122681 TaxID=1314788 RepID=A0A6A6TBJ8_9PLEO|nr:hypothetical protein K491DRAFT_715827 [Lophiostoma macrostomum CBS 122681]